MNKEELLDKIKSLGGEDYGNYFYTSEELELIVYICEMYFARYFNIDEGQLAPTSTVANIQESPFSVPCEKHQDISAHIIKGPNNGCFACYIEAVKESVRRE